MTGVITPGGITLNTNIIKESRRWHLQVLSRKVLSQLNQRQSLKVNLLDLQTLSLEQSIKSQRVI